MLIDTSSIVWGDVGTWVSGVGTFGAVVAAVYYSQRAERRTSDQALANVNAWVWFDPEVDEWRLVINNKTDAPLYQWEVRIWWTQPLDPKRPDADVTHEELGQIPPGRFSYSPGNTEDLPDNDALVKIEIAFVDQMGATRVRTINGRLTTSRERFR